MVCLTYRALLSRTLLSRFRFVPFITRSVNLHHSKLHAGHGGQVEDQNGDESDGYDECIYPVDHKIAGPIIDDEVGACLALRSRTSWVSDIAINMYDQMHDIMARPLPTGYGSIRFLYDFAV